MKTNGGGGGASTGRRPSLPFVVGHQKGTAGVPVAGAQKRPSAGDLFAIFQSLRRVSCAEVTPERSHLLINELFMLDRLGLVDPLTFNPSEAFLTVLVD